MIVRHWSACNNSGMHHAAEACAEAERRLGHDSKVVNVDVDTEWEETVDADVHVAHTHFPDAVRKKITKPYRVVFVAHATPEHVLENSIDAAARPGYGPADGWMLLRHWLRDADATVTFWDRHAAFYRSLVGKHAARSVHAVPMGVDVDFWKQGTNHGKYAGAPSVWMSENQHRMKWALDTLMAWTWVAEAVPDARLHAHYIPWPLHRFFIDLANSNGTAYRSYLSANMYSHDSFRNMWKSLDLFLSPVRYGDHNCIFMQAAAAGPMTISYAGNPYADFWIPEGDQREMANALIRIFRKELEPRADKLPIPSLTDMGNAMVAVYEGLF